MMMEWGNDQYVERP